MANRRIPKRRRPSPVPDSTGNEPEFIDDDEIVLAEDDEVEMIADDEVEEITGEVEEITGEVEAFREPPEQATSEYDAPAVDAPSAQLDEAEDAEDLEETGEHELPAALANSTEVVTDEHADPLAAFAANTRRKESIPPFPHESISPDDADYEEPVEEDVEPTGRALPPEQAPWQEEEEPEQAPDPDLDKEGNPTRRLTPPFAKAPTFDDEVTDRSDKEGEELDEAADESIPKPAFELEPIGRHRRRRRPRSSERDSPEAGQAVDLADDGVSEEADEDLVSAADGTAVEVAPDAEIPPWHADDDEATMNGRQEPGEEPREVLQWSQVPADEDSAMPDAGPTRIETSEPGLPARDEKTLIFSDPDAVPAEEPPEPECPFLVIIQGEEEGREFDMLRAEFTVGRGPDNDLVFPDIACSRQHAMFEQVGDRWQVSDLGSGNGTLLNGERIKQAILVDGDEIEVGNTVLQFNDPAPSGAAAAPADIGPRSTTVTGAMPLDKVEGGGFFAQLTADPKKKKMLVYGGVGLGGFIVLLLIMRLIIPSGPVEPTPEEIARQEALNKQKQFDSHMRKVDLAIQSKNWKDALLEVQLANALVPENRNLKDYLDTIKREMGAASAMEQARMFMEQKAWDSAIAAVNRVTGESEYKSEADSLKVQIDSQITENLLREGQDLMRAGKHNQALLKFDEVLKRNPGNTEVTLAKRQCEEEIAREERDRRFAQRPTHRPKRRKRHSTPRPADRSSVTGQTLSLYRNGEIDRAIAKAEGSGSADQLKLLKQFKSAYQSGMKLAKNPGQAPKAIVELKRALGLDSKIAGGGGKYRSEISERLGRVFYIRGVDAQTRRDFPTAYKAYRAALKYEPGLERAQNKLKELEKEAKKLYEEAYVIKATSADRAVKQLSIVMKIIPPDHVYYSKAKKLMARIQGPLGDTGGSSGF